LRSTRIWYASNRGTWYRNRPFSNVINKRPIYSRRIIVPTNAYKVNNNYDKNVDMTSYSSMFLFFLKKDSQFSSNVYNDLLYLFMPLRKRCNKKESNIL